MNFHFTNKKNFIPKRGYSNKNLGNTETVFGLAQREIFLAFFAQIFSKLQGKH